MGYVGQGIQTSSCKMDNFWESNVRIVIIVDTQNILC